MVKKVIADPDSSKAPGFDCILVLVLKNLTWAFLYVSWSFRYVFEKILFSILLEILITGSFV